MTSQTRPPSSQLLTDDLLALLAVARAGSITKAATELGVDSSTISRRLDRLERSVKGRVVERVPGSWRLTPMGMRLQACAQGIHQSLVEATAVVEEHETGPLHGRVTLLAPEGFGTFLAPWALRETTRRYPDVEVEICTFTHQLPLATRSYDIAISLEEPHVKGLVSQPLCRYSLGLFATPEYLAEQPPIADESDLDRHRFVYYLDNLLDVSPLRVLSEVVSGAHYQANSVSVQVQLVAAGHGIGLLPRYVTGFHPDLVPVLPHVVSFDQQYWLSASALAQRTPQVRQVASDLIAAFSYQDLDNHTTARRGRVASDSSAAGGGSVVRIDRRARS